MYNKIIKWSIYLVVFLLPLFFLPFSFEAFEFNKQYLLFFLVSLAFLSWLAKMILVDREIRFKRTPLDLFILAFLFIALLSAVFSVDKNSSMFGFYGRFSDGLINLISLVILYFLITNNVKPQITADELPITADKELAKISQKSALISVNGLIKTFLWSAFFVILFSYLSVFGVWAKIGAVLGGVFPQIMFQRIFNPVSGSLEGLAVFLSIVLVLICGLMLFEREKSKIKSFINWLLLLAILFLLLIIDFTPAWLVILGSLVLFAAVALWKRIFKEDVNKLLLPLLLAILAGVFLFVNVLPMRSTLLKFSLLQEQVLNQSQSWQIAFKGATENVKAGFLGSGIGTFHYDFAKFKPAKFNESQFWQIRFDRAGSYITELLGTMGFLGLLSYLGLIGLFLIVSWLLFSGELKTKNGKAPTADIKLPLLTVFLALIISQFVYYQNTVLAFMFWLILGLNMVNWQREGRELKYSFKDFPEMSLVFSILLIVIAIGALGIYFFGVRFYLADTAYVSAFRADNELTRIKDLERAVGLNPQQVQYKIILARTYLIQVLTETRKPENEQDTLKIQNSAKSAIDEVRVATELSPNNVVAWENLGMVYREIRTLASGASEWGIKSFERAITLDPLNPVLHTELGKLLVVDDPEEAEKEFLLAQELKPNYLDAIIQQVLMLESQGNSEEAIKKLEDWANVYPYESEILFQLGRLYYNANRQDEAILVFQQVILFYPEHSNAHYALGVAYTAKGEKDLAIAELERVLELNPGNQDVIDKLEKLRK